MIRQHMDQSGSQLLWGPSVKPATIAGRSGIRAEFDSAAMGRPIATAAFYTPAAEDSLEVSCLAEIDDRERSLRTLHQVVSRLRPLRS